MDLKAILATMKKTYSFIIKVAAEIKPEDFKDLDVILRVKGMSKRTNPESMNLASLPVDFPRLKDYYGRIYKIQMDFDYPITENQLRTEICNAFGLSRAYVIVRTAESPLEQYQNNYLDYKDEDGESILMDDSDKSDVNVDELYGDIYNQELVKTLQSKEAKKYQKSFKEVDPKYYNKGK